MAVGLGIVVVLLSMPVVGLLVNAVALLAARLLGPIHPAASPWPQARLELLNVLGRNPWLPLAHATVAVASAVAAASVVAIVLPPYAAPEVLLSACAIANGMLAIVAALLSHDRSEARWWPANAGLIGISAGVLNLVWRPAAILVVVVICIWGFASGMFLLSGANRPPGTLRNAQLVRWAGIASLTLGGASLYLLRRLFI